MKINKGSALSQYSIIIAIIALALVPIFLIFGRTIVDSFTGLSHGFNFQVNTPPASVVEPAATPSQTGPLVGTSDNPEQKCVDSFCSIDFGEFVLNGIPENFQDYLQEQGTPGGTKTLAGLFQQIADQLAQNGDLEGSVEYRKLANLGHYMASVQGYIENKTEGCISHEYPSSCFVSALDSRAGYIPYNTDTAAILTSQKTSGRPYTFLSATRIDLARNLQTTNKASFDSSLTGNVGVAFVQYYDNIMNNPKYSEKQKSITQALYLQLNELTLNMGGQAARFNKNSVPYYDPLTGEQLGTKNFVIQDNTNFSDILHPQYSDNSNLRSQLICVSGRNRDSGKECFSR